ncbi:Oligopeptide transport system permease protein oppC Stage 0 sporulation protein KC [Proteiniborus sp. DW1]|uniref:ABC transporter permease n=1 Tax=Proteiniborus sp. DW1 TaxID=1889883 RepID=UPI00092DEE85|nr:ABC transporter permease [Proteiniborus sp. DW1]SCG83025.1 Oligopeptide transport system permease protein oppC Stage 0 sporulation protein KC [Proteiniborus sp. DW1]
MYTEQDIINRDISETQFEFVQQDQKIYDQKIQGKPIGYLQDVWMRFKKNRANLVATTILITLIICSIIMPGLSGKEYIKLNEKISFLPPRVPVLEKFGIFDGTVLITDKPVDLSKMDEETGLYLPLGYNEKAVDISTLTNTRVESLDKAPNVIGGQSVLKLDHDSTSVTVESNEFYSLSMANNAYIEVDVFELDNTSNGKIEVLLQTEFGSDYRVIDTITETGKHKVMVFDLCKDLATDVVSKIRIRYSSDNKGSSAAIASISLFDDSSEEPILVDEGYELSIYKIADGKGSYVRQNSEMMIASFRYNRYIAAFDLTHELAFSSTEYDRLLEEWGDNVEIIPNPDNPEGWYFSEGFPIREVVRKNDTVTVDGKSYSSYEVYLDYAAYLGYDELPYFLFGTTQAGRDLFSLTWIALRTSLFIGLVVTFINVSIGVVYGAISGYYGGTVDLLMQRLSELIGNTPWLVVLSILVTLYNPGFKTLILTLVISGWTGPAATTRMQFYRYKGQEYVLASRTLGAKDSRLIFRHILPNGIGTIITSSILSIPGTIFTEASLSFLGYGIGHGQSFNILGVGFSGVSIGVLLSDARNFLVTQPYLTIFPAIIVSLLMITFNLFGNALRDAFNPSLRGVED